MIEINNGLKINYNCLRINNKSFLCLGTSKTLSLGEFDECETHLILNPFFMHIWNLNVQFKEKLWNLHPDLCFVGFIAKETKRARKATNLVKNKKSSRLG